MIREYNSPCNRFRKEQAAKFKTYFRNKERIVSIEDLFKNPNSSELFDDLDELEAENKLRRIHRAEKFIPCRKLQKIKQSKTCKKSAIAKAAELIKILKLSLSMQGPLNDSS